MSRQFVHLLADNVGSPWRPLDPAESELVARLWRGKPSNEDMELAKGFLARVTGKGICYSLALPKHTGMDRKASRSAPYVGDAIDADGCMVQAVLILDKEGWPLELEVFRLDGADLQTKLSALNFELIEE